MPFTDNRDITRVVLKSADEASAEGLAYQTMDKAVLAYDAVNLQSQSVLPATKGSRLLKGTR